MPAEYDLSPHQLLRPPKVRWVLDQKETALASIKSKGTRKFLTNATQVLEAAQISYSFTELNQDSFNNWYEYYKEKMLENSFDILAKPDWYSQKISEGTAVFGIFLHKDGKMIGSAIIYLAEHHSSMAYKASEKISLGNDSNSSLGAVIDYYYIEEMMKLNIMTITSGRSRNAFGVTNKLGYLDYKLKFGYYPVMEKSEEPTPIFLLNERGFGVSFCHPQGQTGLTMVQVCQQNQEQAIEASRFAGEFFDYQIITY